MYLRELESAKEASESTAKVSLLTHERCRTIGRNPGSQEERTCPRVGEQSGPSGSSPCSSPPARAARQPRPRQRPLRQPRRLRRPPRQPRPLQPRLRPRSTSSGGTSRPASPARATSRAIADAYMAANPNVKINITVLENEAFKTKLATSLQSGDVPDLFQSWGGGTMAAQADAGMLKDITADVSLVGRHRQPRRHEHLRLQRQAVRRAVGHGHDRVLVQQGPVRQGRDHRRRPRRGTTSRPLSPSSRTPALHPSPSPARTSGRRCTFGPTSCSATVAGRPWRT